MANRRMFSKSITNSSQFLMMPQSSQNLYFHLGMNADDDGFCEHFTIMRMTESKPDDLKVLNAKGFVKVFDDKVLVIIDWKENNYLRNDRYTPSKYLEVYKKELKQIADTFGIPMVYQMDTQDRIGKVRKELGEVVIKGKKEKKDAPTEIEKQLKEETEKINDLLKTMSEVFKFKLNSNNSSRLFTLINLHGLEKSKIVASKMNKWLSERTNQSPFNLVENFGKWLAEEDNFINSKEQYDRK